MANLIITQARRNLAFLLCCLLICGVSSSVSATQSRKCVNSERFPNALLKIGDSERQIIALEPDREVRTETEFGGVKGFRFDFYRQGRTIQVFTEDGVISKICRVRN